MIPITSSFIDGVDHDGDALIVKMRGATYRYPTAPAHHVDGMKQAESAGQYFREHILGTHEHER